MCLQESVLGYIDEQVCSRLLGEAKKQCKEMVGNKGKELLEGIRSGTVRIEEGKEKMCECPLMMSLQRSALLCTRFHVCLDQILDKTSAVPQVS